MMILKNNKKDNIIDVVNYDEYQVVILLVIRKLMDDEN